MLSGGRIGWLRNLGTPSRVVEGAVRFVARTDPVTDVIVDVEHPQRNPPGVEHHVEPQGPTRFQIDFLAP